jgi:hypothetical protein
MKLIPKEIYQYIPLKRLHLYADSILLYFCMWHVLYLFSFMLLNKPTLTYKQKVNWRIHFVSQVHAFVAVSYALFNITSEGFSNMDYLFGHSVQTEKAFAITAG